MKGFLFTLLILLSFSSFATTVNPCEYMNINSNTMNQLDTGNDQNFERIKQQNNQQLILACQAYEIKLLEQSRNDLNRDNY